MKEILIVVPLYNNASIVSDVVTALSAVDDADILCIDDGSDDDTFEMMKEFKPVTCIRHEQALGYGAVVQSGLKYSQDMGYETVAFCDPCGRNLINDISAMKENINYGYDIVTCSRILENYDHESVDEQVMAITAHLSARIQELTGYDITDPLSGIFMLKTGSIQDMDLTDPTHGVILQLFIQGAHFGLDVLEIPSESYRVLGGELFLYEDSLGIFLSLLETESYLYKKGSLN